MRLSELWPHIERSARDAGALHVGVSDLDDANSDIFARWLSSGHHASMHYLEKNLETRLQPAQRFPWARSVLALLVPYSPERPHAEPGAVSNHIARYALGEDYHRVLDDLLKIVETTIVDRAPETRTWRYVDTGPLSDRALAAQAGLGWIGRNGMLINESDGSYFFIGTLLTSLENDIKSTEVGDRCGTCTRCVDACPTEAILPGRVVASAQCISYATIEHRGSLAEPIAHRLGGNAFGCDICQEVCPWNGQPPDPHPSFITREAYRATPITDLLQFNQAEFSSFFTRSAIKRAKLAGMKRNVEAIVAAARESAEY